MGKLSREKGARYERAIANWMQLVASVFSDWRRELRETQQGNIGDVYDSKRTHPIVIQTKHMKRPSPFGAWREARKGAKKRGYSEDSGVAIIRRHGGETIVIMSPAMFACLLHDSDKLPFDFESVPEIDV